MAYIYGKLTESYAGGLNPNIPQTTGPVILVNYDDKIVYTDRYKISREN